MNKKARTNLQVDANDPDSLKYLLQSLQSQVKQLGTENKTSLPKICAEQPQMPESASYRDVIDEPMVSDSSEEDSEESKQIHSERMFSLAVQQVSLFPVLSSIIDLLFISCLICLVMYVSMKPCYNKTQTIQKYCNACASCFKIAYQNSNKHGLLLCVLYFGRRISFVVLWQIDRVLQPLP